MEIDPDDCCLHGKLLYINDLVTYESDSVDGLRQEFEAAVDDYLETCQELGQEPNKPFKGTFNVRIGPDLHRKLTFKAAEMGLGINEAVTKAVADFVQETPTSSEFLNDVHDHLRRYVFEYQSTFFDLGRTPHGHSAHVKETYQSSRLPPMKGSSFVVDVRSANGH